MKKITQKNREILKSNNLIESSYRLTTAEQRLIYIASTKLKRIIITNKMSLEEVKEKIEKAQFEKISIDVTEYKKEFNIKSNRIYEELEATATKLYNRNIIYINGNKIIHKRWVITCEYDNKMGTISLQFHPDLIKDLLIFKSHFTILQYDFAKNIKNSYTYRIYELLKQYELYTKRTFELTNLRFLLGIPDDKYPKYCNLKQKVINPSLIDINRNTDLYCELEEIKIKRKVVKIKFIIRPQKVINKNQQLSFLDMPINNSENIVTKLEDILGIMITADQANIILNVALDAMSEHDIINIEVLDYIKDKKNVVDNYCKNNSVDSYVGLLIKALQGNWTLSKKDKKTNFADYDGQRNYNYKNLEKMASGEIEYDSTKILE